MNISRQAADAAIERICQAGVFGSSSRSSSLLRYLVHETLDGRGERLKAYSIGLDVMQRNDDFDPVQDSTVRVEMHRLRAALADYYANAGHSDPIRITLPKGAYQPVFERRSRAQYLIGRYARYLYPVLGLIGLSTLALYGYPIVKHQFGNERSLVCQSQQPSIAIAADPDSAQTGDPHSDAADKLMDYLAAYRLVSIATGSTGSCHGAPAYILRIKVQRDNPDHYLFAKLQYVGDKTIIWAREYRRDSVGDLAPQDLAVARLAFDLANDNGVIPTDALARDWQAPKSEELFRCTMRARRYFVVEGGAELDQALDCLGKIYHRGTKSATAIALYAGLELSSQLGYSGKQRTAQVSIAKLTQEAEALDPANPELLMLQMRVARNSNPIDLMSLNKYLGAASDTYPMHPFILDNLALTYSTFLNDFDLAAKQDERAQAIMRAPARMDWTQLWITIVKGDWADSKRYMRYLKAAKIPRYDYVILAIAGHTGDSESLNYARADLASHHITDRKAALESVNSLNYSKPIMDIIHTAILENFA